MPGRVLHCGGERAVGYPFSSVTMERATHRSIPSPLLACRTVFSGGGLNKSLTWQGGMPHPVSVMDTTTAIPVADLQLSGAGNWQSDLGGRSWHLRVICTLPAVVF